MVKPLKDVSPKKVLVRGEMLTFKEISEKYGIPLHVVSDRVFKQKYEGEEME